jgi:hypothetical protein
MSSSAARRPARIRFLTHDQGGRTTPPESGSRSQIEIGDITTSCTITRVDGGREFPLGDDVQVVIELMFPEQFRTSFADLRLVRLFEGSKLVAEGSFD